MDVDITLRGYVEPQKKICTYSHALHTQSEDALRVKPELCLMCHISMTSFAKIYCHL
jgi:hypothetical protein